MFALPGHILTPELSLPGQIPTLDPFARLRPSSRLPKPFALHLFPAWPSFGNRAPMSVMNGTPLADYNGINLTANSDAFGRALLGADETTGGAGEPIASRGTIYLDLTVRSWGYFGDFGRVVSICSPTGEDRTCFYYRSGSNGVRFLRMETPYYIDLAPTGFSVSTQRHRWVIAYYSATSEFRCYFRQGDGPVWVHSSTSSNVSPYAVSGSVLRFGNRNAYDRGFDGTYHAFALYGETLSDLLCRQLITDPYNTMFEPAVEQILLQTTAAGTPTLTAAAVDHAHTLDAATVSVGYALTAAAVDHAHTLDAATVSVGYALTAAAIDHAHALDSATLSALGMLTAAAVDHAHALDAATVSVDYALTAAAVDHAHALDAATVSVDYALTAAAVDHAHALDAATVSVDYALTAAAIDHAHALDATTLSVLGVLTAAAVDHAHALDAAGTTPAYSLTVAELAHAITLDVASINEAVPTLTVAELLHAHGIDAVTVTQAGYLLVISDLLHAHLLDAMTWPVDMPAMGVILKVPGERRTLIVAPERRTLSARIH